MPRHPSGFSPLCSLVAGVLPILSVGVVAGCQAGIGGGATVAPVPPLVLGLPLFLTPEPQLLKIEDPAARPLAVTLEHNVRDALEEAGFKLVATKEAAAGIVATLVIQRGEGIGTDLFIHGAKACGVRLEITRADARLASGEPEVECVSTSSYYGVLAKDAAVGMVNTVSRAPALIAVAETLHPPPPPPPPSKVPHEPDPQPELPR